MTTKIRSQSGMTLVEVLASMMVFAIVTVGVVPLLGSALRGTELARAQTVARDTALQGMERARSLPYFVSYGAQTRKVDVLDIYFPCAQAPATNLTSCGGEGTRTFASGVFTTVCASGVIGSTCSIPLPAGYSVTYAAKFVAPDGITLVSPPTNYKRNPNLTTEGQLDLPPSQLLELSVTVNWVSSGTPRSYLIRSIIGDRKVGVVKMAGVGRINYGVQASTSFVEPSGRVSDLRLVAGTGESQLETRLVSTSRQVLDVASVSLVRRPETESASSEVLGTLVGATASLNAPPSQSVTPAPASGATLNYPALVPPQDVAEIASTQVQSAQTSVVTELPSASGTFTYLSTPSRYLWIQNQADVGSNTILKLDGNRKVFSLYANDSSARLTGSTSGTSTPLGAGRKVETTATVTIPLLRFMPVTFIVGGPDWRRHVLMIDNFTATVRCTSTASGTASSIASWSGTLTYWRDPSDNGSLVDAGFINPPVSISSASGNTDLQTLLGGNPLVYDGLLPADDVYLFQPTIGNGYFTNFTLKTGGAAVRGGGAETNASIDGALNVTTVPTNPLLPESGLNISIGSLTCEALDKR